MRNRHMYFHSTTTTTTNYYYYYYLLLLLLVRKALCLQCVFFLIHARHARFRRPVSYGRLRALLRRYEKRSCIKQYNVLSIACIKHSTVLVGLKALRRYRVDTALYSLYCMVDDVLAKLFWIQQVPNHILVLPWSRRFRCCCRGR